MAESIWGKFSSLGGNTLCVDGEIHFCGEGEIHLSGEGEIHLSGEGEIHISGTYLRKFVAAADRDKEAKAIPRATKEGESWLPSSHNIQYA